MDYPIIYDKLETDFTHYGLAVLENVINPRIFERLNGEYVLDFSIPRTDEKFDAIQEENIVKINGQLFVIRTLTEQRTNNNELIANVFCEHISSELITEYKQSVSLTASTPQTIVNALFSGTRFTGTAVSVLGTHSFIIERKNVISCINHFIAITDSEMKRDNFNIEFKPQIGADNGVAFRYRKNLKGIKRTIDSKNIVTRLYVYGKDGLSIAPIDSANIGLYPRPKVGEITFSDIDDTVKLQQLGQEQFTVKKIDIPYVTYEVDVVELKKAEGYDETEGFAIGDTVGVFDEELNLSLMARIVEYEEYPLQPENSRAVLANFIPTIEDALTQLQDTRSIVEQVTRNGKLNTYWLDGVINALTNQIKASGSYANATALANKGFLLENNDINSPDYGAMYLGPGWLMIANTKLGDGSWNWRTFGTGKGFTADLINAGLIQAQYIQIGSGTNFSTGYDPSTKETPTDAQTKADTAQTNAINTAATDATTKANNAQTTAISSAANDATTKANTAETNAKNASVPKAVQFDNSVTIGDGNGITVKDGSNVLRAQFGQYAAGKYGVLLKNKTGTTTILDEDGMMQTDTIQLADNVDTTHSLKMKIYVDDGVISVNKVKLNFSLEAFRAYSTGAASGGGVTATSASGGGSTNYFGNAGGVNFGSTLDTSKSFITNSGVHNHTASTGSAGSHNHGGSAAAHNHGLAEAANTAPGISSDGTHSHSVTVDNAGSHYHLLYDFFLTMPNHTHDVTIPSHTHSIVYGIYEGSSATGVKVKVDGIERLNNGGVGYSTDQNSLDLTAWITTSGWHTVELTSTQLGRINASLYIKSFVGV